MKQLWKPFVLLLTIGLTTIWLLLPAAKNFIYSNGKELVAWYIPLPVSLLFFLLNVYYRKPPVTTTIFTVILFLLLWIPFIGNLTDTYLYYEQDDGTRYRMVATNMVKQNTLNAGDGVIFGTDDKVYMIQPGYRYYLALWIKIFGNENRLYQLFNMLVYLCAVLLFIMKAVQVPVKNSFKTGMLGFVLLSSPFVVKLIMMGLTEWLAISIFLLAIGSYLSRYILLAVMLLALVPFIRQNLIFVSLLLMIWIVLREKRKLIPVFAYLAILLLPLYHNLFFAGKWQFFSMYNDPSTYTIWDFEGSYITKLFKNVLYHLSLYSGFNFRLNNFFAQILSLACIPLGTYLVIHGYFLLKKENRWWYLLIVASAIGPTLIFGGSAYYPRFEWVNLFTGIIVFVILQKDTVYKKLIWVDREATDL